MRTARPVLSTLSLLLAPNLVNAQASQPTLCALFTAAEITALLGTAVDNGTPIVVSPGCQWFGQDEESYAIVQVADSTNWFDPQQAPGYQVIAGTGRRAYSHPEEGGWRAMALIGGTVAVVVLSGGSAKRDDAVTLLRRLVERQ